MTHTLKFERYIKTDALNAMRLMVSLFEANYTQRGEVSGQHLLTVDEMSMVYAPMLLPTSPFEAKYTQHQFHVVAGDKCADPFTALATFFARLAEYGLTKKYGAELYYRAKPDISWEIDFAEGVEYFKCYARLVLVGDDEANPRYNLRSTD